MPLMSHTRFCNLLVGFTLAPFDGILYLGRGRRLWAGVLWMQAQYPPPGPERKCSGISSEALPDECVTERVETGSIQFAEDFLPGRKE
ncbi:MAG: hypothetical protein N2512_10360 [Armatimonadetes bacterium]|nr:hypothetical protein [Armatimonadota bacterium]